MYSPRSARWVPPTGVAVLSHTQRFHRRRRTAPMPTALHIVMQCALHHTDPRSQPPHPPPCTFTPAGCTAPLTVTAPTPITLHIHACACLHPPTTLTAPTPTTFTACGLHPTDPHPHNCSNNTPITVPPIPQLHFTAASAAHTR